MSKIREVIVLTCAGLLLAIDATHRVLSLLLESTFSEESRKTVGNTAETGQAGEESRSHVL